MVACMSRWEEQYKIDKSNAKWLKRPGGKKRKPTNFNMRVSPNGYIKEKDLNKVF